MAFPLVGQIAEGMSANEFKESVKAFRQLASGGVKNFTQMCAVVELMANAESHIVHRDILLNLSAIYIIRDDENPVIINNDIHAEKIKYLESEISNDPHAFFLAIAIQELKDLQELSPQELQRQWTESPKRIKAVSDFLNKLLVESGLQNFVVDSKIS